MSNLSELLEQEILQAKCASCCLTSNAKALMSRAFNLVHIIPPYVFAVFMLLNTCDCSCGQTELNF